MCGVVGFVNCCSDQMPVEQKFLDRMQLRVAHRGPDGHGMWVSDNGQIGLAHRRLSILDLSDAAAQPMFDKNRTVVISFNGEIYNHPELRKELEKLGHCYSSNSDTETILYAYKQWGIDSLRRFEGMFAFALYDIYKDELYLVRDRIGIKPLYFSLQGDRLSFASEIKALWELPWIKKELNPEGLYHYLTYLATPAPMTIYHKIYKLPAGFYIKIDRQRKISFHEWYDLLKPSVTYSTQELNDEQFCINKIRSLLQNSIRTHMLSDVPYGVFLSGGIDSSLNVALMSKFVDRVKTFNVSFSDGPEFCERAWARRVAKQFNTEHHEIVISEKEAFDFFEKMVYYQDEPLADCVCIPLYYVAKLLKDAGVTVVQVGEGSDELFCGYTSYARYVDTYYRWWRPSSMLPSFVRKKMFNLIQKAFPRYDAAYLDIAYNWALDRKLFWGGAIALTERTKRGLWNAPISVDHDPVIEQIYGDFRQCFDSYTVVDYHLNKFRKQNPQPDFLQSMIYLEFKQRLPELLLMRVDKMAMATAVEGRVPFLDHPMVEFALQIPSKFKYKNGTTKYILKKACEGILPNDVIYRKKVGFAAPTKRWLKSGTYFKPYFLDMLATKEKSINSYLNVMGIKRLFEHNQRDDVDNTLYLWTLQNVMALDVL